VNRPATMMGALRRMLCTRTTDVSVPLLKIQMPF
jgi:hypothetical protein